MKRTLMMMRESFRLARKHKIYFLLPLLLVLAALALFAYQIGPGVVVSFIYAGL